ncbi:MAG: efflux RND transporter periplasmic adaptor subunit [Rhodocyclaceae bacterium]
MKRSLLIKILMLALLPYWATASEWTSRPLAEVAIYPEFRASARVEPLNEARVAAEVGGRIEAIPPRMGERVTAGAELARIDAAEYRIGVERAAAQAELVFNRVRLAEAQLEQSRALAGRGFISDEGLRIRETELAVLRSELTAARQGLEAARLQLARTVVRAPFDGVVRERLASVGDLAVAGTPVVVLASSDETEIRAAIPSGQLAWLRTASGVVLHVDQATYHLRLERVLSLVESAGQAQTVVFSSSAALAPGLAGEVRWRAATPHLPAEYLLRRDGRLGVWLDRGGEAVFVPLPGAATGRPAAVGDLADARVIDEGRFSLGLPRVPAQGAELPTEGGR